MKLYEYRFWNLVDWKIEEKIYFLKEIHEVAEKPTKYIDISSKRTFKKHELEVLDKNNNFLYTLNPDESYARQLIEEFLVADVIWHIEFYQQQIDTLASNMDTLKKDGLTLKRTK